MRKEIDYFNILKSLSIVFVCAIHGLVLTGTVPERLSFLLLYTAVPLFFAVNGALLFAAPFDEKKHFRRTLTLIAVSTAWRGILLVASMLSPWYTVELSLSGVINYFLGVSLPGVAADHLWFIKALIALYVLFPLLKIAFDNSRRVLLVFTAVIGGVCILSQSVSLIQTIVCQGLGREVEPINLWQLREYIPLKSWHILYFVGGGFAHQYLYVEGHLPTRKQRWLGAGAVLLGMGILFTLSGLYMGFDGKVLEPFGKYAADGGYCTLSTLLMTGGLYVLLCGVELKNTVLRAVFRAVGRNTLTVFYTHFFLALPLSNHLLSVGFVGIIPNLLKSLLLVTVGTVLGICLKKIPLLKLLA